MVKTDLVMQCSSNICLKEWGETSSNTN